MPQLASEVPKVPPNMAPRIKLTYPYSDKWEYETFLEKINRRGTNQRSQDW